MEILEKPSPLVAKWTAKRKDYKPFIRDDWEDVKLEVMDYCLRFKLITHWVKFGDLLRRTGRKDIVEISSKKDRFWGAAPDLSHPIRRLHITHTRRPGRCSFTGR